MGRYLTIAAAALLALTVGLGFAQAPSGAPPVLGLPTFGLDAAQVPAGQYVFTGAEDWTGFWSRYSSQPAPELDFSRWQVVAIFLGRRPNPGYSVRVMGYAPQGAQTVVNYQEFVPAPGSVWAQVVTYPADLAAIPAGRPVRFAGTTGPRGLMPPVARDLPYHTVDATGLSAQVPEQFVALTTQAAWEQFWHRYGKGGAPAVDFARGQMVIGVVGSRSQMTLSRVTRAGGVIAVTLGPGTQPTCPGEVGHRSLLLIVPQVTRVDLQYQPFCK